jgi:hypothetical protein
LKRSDENAKHGPSCRDRNEARTRAANGSALSVPFIVIAGLAAATLAGAVSPARTQPATNAVVPYAGSTAAAGHEITRVSLPGPVYDLTYDTARNSMWFAHMALGSPSTLFEYSLSDGSLKPWALPAADYNGFVTRVRLAPDGSIWLNQLYSIVRFDPASESVTQLNLPQADTDAISSALSPDNPSPGTWPAAITVEANGTVLISRHNVRSITAISPDERVLGRLALPSGVVGPVDLADVDGTVYVASPNVIAAVSEDGNAVPLIGPGVFHLARNGSDVLGIGPTSVVMGSKTAVSVLRTDGGSAKDLGVLSADYAFLWRRDLPGVQKVDRTGAITSVLKFSTTAQTRDRPNGQAATWLDSDQVTAMATDSVGSLWAVEVTTTGTYLVHLDI